MYHRVTMPQLPIPVAPSYLFVYSTCLLPVSIDTLAVVQCREQEQFRQVERVVPDRLVGLTVKHACTIALTQALHGLREVSNLAKHTFGLLSYFRRGLPPQTNCLLASIYSETYYKDQGILSSRLPLYLSSGCTLTSYSQASKGLLVQLEVIRIFTDNSISPSSSWRQWELR